MEPFSPARALVATGTSVLAPLLVMTGAAAPVTGSAAAPASSDTAADESELDIKVNRRTFALEFAALLDGLSIQVALEDPEVDSEVAYDIAMRFAERELDLLPAKKRVNGRPRAVK